MSKRRDDFDEFSDPENPRELKYEEIAKASERIRNRIIKTPCLASHHSKDLIMHVYYKLENLQRTGSFKERGALNALLGLSADKKKIGVVVSSVGNHAVAICHHAGLMNIPVTVVMPPSVPINKLQQCHALGAKVMVQGNNITEAQRFARSLAREKGLTYINGRDHPAMLAGHGTIAMEILEQVPFVEAVIVPVGTGGLAAATAVVIKQIKPSCLVYGVEPEVMPALFNSLERGQPETCPIVNTIADSIAIPGVGVNAFCTVKSRLDKMLLVKEDWIARSILHLIEKERLVVEGAGACPLAAILADLAPELKTKTVVCVLSGGNIDTILLARALDRGLAAEARLVKFKVGIRDTNDDLTQLLRLMAANNYNVTRSFRDQVWVEDDVYHCEYKFVVETRGMEHALELKRIMERAYPRSAIFETEPFNDRRTCPCYVRKAIK